MQFLIFIYILWISFRSKNLKRLLVWMSVGADTLKDAMASTNDKALGIGRYHTWSDNDRARLFGERVLAVHQNLMESTKQ